MRKSMLCIALAFAARGAALSQTPAEPAVQPKAPALESVRLVPVEPFSYAALEMRGSYDQHANAFMDLMQNAGAQGISMAAAPFGLYFNSPGTVAADSLVWDLGIPCPDTARVTAPLVRKKYAYPLTAALFFEGVFGSPEQNAATAALLAWIPANGYRPAGPMMERFVSMPMPTGDGGFTGRVEMVIPVEKVK
ncbi:MAG: GyrI-like domain-containing protein [bacterium]|nr:GyrI-like domain-containing protein [bacterium]